MIEPLGNSMLCEAVDIEDTNIDLGRKFGDNQGWRVVEFGLKFEFREPITNDDILDTNPKPYSFFFILVSISSGFALKICPSADSIVNNGIPIKK